MKNKYPYFVRDHDKPLLYLSKNKAVRYYFGMYQEFTLSDKDTVIALSAATEKDIKVYEKYLKLYNL